MKWKKLFAIPAAALLLFATACNESAPSEISQPDGLVESEPSPTPANTDALLKMGDVISYNAPSFSLPIKLEITVTGVQVFDSFADSGIPVEETQTGSLNEVLDTDQYKLPETPFVLVDVTIKETEGPEEREPPEDGIPITMFSLHSKQQIDWYEENYPEGGPILREPEYFSGHEEQDAEGKGYGYFWMEPGQEQAYQVGFFLTDLEELANARNFHPESRVASPDEGLVLGIGSNLNYSYVDLETDKE